MADRFSEVIDLSDSLILADHRALTDVVIVLDTDESDDSGLIELDSDDSIVEVVHTASSVTSTACSEAMQHRQSHKKNEHNPLVSIYRKYETALKNLKIADKVTGSKKQKKLGECPICFDSLGQNPLASTKCGHVYCMKCIEQYLQFDKRCPTCRQSLKGKTAYHPLYLNS